MASPTWTQFVVDGWIADHPRVSGPRPRPGGEASLPAPRLLADERLSAGPVVDGLAPGRRPAVAVLRAALSADALRAEQAVVAVRRGSLEGAFLVGAALSEDAGGEDQGQGDAEDEPGHAIGRSRT